MKTFKTNAGTELQLISLKGKDYLPVAQRLVWFREECMFWSIETKIVEMTEKHAIVMATITNDQGRVIATAHKREDQGHFGDYIEKAETGAIGRALAYVGYGTQFCADELDEQERIVDAPIEKRPAANRPGLYAKPEPKKVTKMAPPESASPSFDEFNKEYRVTFGVYSGKTLQEIGEKNARGYAAHLANQAAKNGGQLAKPEAEFVKAVAEKFKSAVV